MLNQEWLLVVFPAFFLTTVTIKLLRRPAHWIGLLDHPGQRKHHQGAVPLTGGIAMCVSFLLCAPFLDISLQPYTSLLIAAVIMTAVGVGDDRYDLSTTGRFLAQGIAALVMALMGGVYLVELGDLIGFGNIELNDLSLPFTVICVIGVINGLNMIDGLDGLAGGVTFIAIFWLAVLVGQGSVQPAAGADILLMTVLLAVIAGFLSFNMRLPWRRRAAIFMGDAGSMFLGTILVWFLVDLSQGPTRAFAPITAVWILGLPLMDTASVMVRRLIQKRNPFCGDREHLHHLLQRCGLPHAAVTWILLGFSALLGGIGVASWYGDVSEAALFYGFLGVFALFFFATGSISFLLKRSERRREEFSRAG